MQYKVIALSVGGKYNKIFSSGDIVTAESFEADINDLVKQGFVMAIEAEKKAVKVEVSEPKISEEKSIVTAAKKANKK